jgi:hypothetical protein
MKPLKEYYGLKGKTASDCLSELVKIIADYDLKLKSEKEIEYISAPASKNEWVKLAKQRGVDIKDNQSLRLCSAKASYYVFRINGELFIGNMVDGSEENLMETLFPKKDLYNLGSDEGTIATIQKLS